MKVEIKLLKDISEPYAVIYTNTITDEIKKAADRLEQEHDFVIAAKQNGKYVIVQPQEIYMARVENQKVVLYCENFKVSANKRLTELEKQLGRDFLRISKFTLINLKQIDHITPSFNGMMYITLKNGCKDSISRKYLPEFKKYLGL